MRTITWKNDNGKTCILTIKDDNGGVVTEMTPAAEPFTTSIQESDDIFTPIRSSNGYIRVVVNDVDDISDLVGAAPLSRAVTLTVDGTVRWRGFLACESFTQPWDKAPLELELPVMSALEVARGVYPSAALADLGYINIAQFLYNMNVALGATTAPGFAWIRYYFPVLSETPGTLQYQFDMKNYATATDKNTKHEMASYYDILEDICKLFGWQAIEYEQDIVFLAADTKAIESGRTNAYRGYTNPTMLNIAQGNSMAPNERPHFTAAIPEIYGADHDLTWLAGKKKVEAVGQLNERDETIWSMDVVGQCVYKGSELRRGTIGMGSFDWYYHKYGAYTNGNIIAYNSLSNFNPDTNGYNLKFYNYGGNSAYGGCATDEMLAIYGNAPSTMVARGSLDYVSRIITKANSSQRIECADIHTNFEYNPTQNKASDVFVIEADIKKADSTIDVFENAPDGFEVEVVLMIKVGSTYHYYTRSNGWSSSPGSISMYVKDGKLDNKQIPAPTDISGEVILRIIASTDTQGTSYVSYENVSIKMFPITETRSFMRKNTIEEAKYRLSENTKQYDLNNGFTESWDQECGLTLAREAVPDSYGVVLDASKAQPANLYDGKYPEDAMALRAKNYFTRARLRIRALVHSVNKMLSPMVPYTFQSGGKPYICIEQTHDWRTDEVRASFYEPTYNQV